MRAAARGRARAGADAREPPLPPLAGARAHAARGRRGEKEEGGGNSPVGTTTGVPGEGEGKRGGSREGFSVHPQGRGAPTSPEKGQRRPKNTNLTSSSAFQVVYPKPTQMSFVSFSLALFSFPT